MEIEIESEVQRQELHRLIDDSSPGDVWVIKKKKARTLTQNGALHKYCEMVSSALNDAGLDMRRVLNEDVDIPWTMSAVKEHMWRPIQKVVIGKDSTTEANTGEYSEVYNVMSRHLSQKLGVNVYWPSLRG